jgi:hypothetical protein
VHEQGITQQFDIFFSPCWVSAVKKKKTPKLKLITKALIRVSVSVSVLVLFDSNPEGSKANPSRSPPSS